MRKKKTKTYAQLKRELDQVFSIWVRKRWSTDGLNHCVTCGLYAPWPKLQAGHYVKRSVLATRWDERNVWPQCVQCNIFKSGNYPNFTQYLLDVLKEQGLRDLLRHANTPLKLNGSDLSALIERYSAGHQQDAKIVPSAS